MKVIYVDVLITVNVFIDFFLILCTKKFLHLYSPYYKIILASIVGGIQSLIALLPPMIFLINIIIDIVGASIIILIAFGKCKIKSYIKRVLTFFILSTSFCGLMIFIYSAFRPIGLAVYNDIVYFNISPVILIIMTLICYYILKLTKRITKGVSGGGVCMVEIVINNRHICFNAKIDSGCNLKEPFSGDYVIVAEKSAIDNFTPEDKKSRIIPFESLGGNGIIKGFKPEKIKIDGSDVSNDIYIGICENIIKGDVKALIPVELTIN